MYSRRKRLPQYRAVSAFDDYDRLFDQPVPHGWFNPLRWDRPYMPDFSAPEALPYGPDCFPSAAPDPVWLRHFS